MKKIKIVFLLILLFSFIGCYNKSFQELGYIDQREITFTFNTKTDVKFRDKDFSKAYVTGSFVNGDWSDAIGLVYYEFNDQGYGSDLTSNDGIYTAKISIPKHTFEYKFVLVPNDQRKSFIWIQDPNNKIPYQFSFNANIEPFDTITVNNAYVLGNFCDYEKGYGNSEFEFNDKGDYPDEKALDGLWNAEVYLPYGEWEYKFYINSSSSSYDDPSGKKKVGSNSQNSKIDVSKYFR
jgi:hypothetical protein